MTYSPDETRDCAFCRLIILELYRSRMTDSIKILLICKSGENFIDRAFFDRRTLSEGREIGQKGEADRIHFNFANATLFRDTHSLRSGLSFVTDENKARLINQWDILSEGQINYVETTVGRNFVGRVERRSGVGRGSRS